jgi:hypothetical protein
VQQNLRVQRFSACLGVVAMVVALVTAPLFHSHDQDDHGKPTALVHAHLLEAHHGESHEEDEVEAPHGDHHARWIDFFVFQRPAAAFVLEIDFSGELLVPVLEQREGVILPSRPRAHSPPDRRHSVPRSPPII